MMLLAQGPGLCPSLFVLATGSDNIISSSLSNVSSKFVITATLQKVEKEVLRLGFEGPLAAVAPIFRSVWIQ